MPIYMSGSSVNSCSGSIRGIFSGSLPVESTGSYVNLSPNSICTGSMLVHSYSNGCQRLYVYLLGTGGMEWVFITGSLGCTDEP